ncbi:MAG: hypothetical protein JNL01_00225 [Bdellovibrionales bacterium]|nr:hypothetical protein [Bdellovibrionales bacterium]
MKNAKPFSKIRSLRFALAATCGLAAPLRAFALGEVIFDASSFLLKSTQRPNASTFLMLGPQLSSEGKYVDTDLDLKVYAYLPYSASISVEAKNAYVATSKPLLNGHQIVLGRKTYEWSQMDEMWQMGLWQPRFLWDPLRPFTVGLTGLTYTYENTWMKFALFGSPVAIPERGSTVYQEGGQIRGFGPFFNPLPNQLDQGNGVITPIVYTINNPNLSDALLRPGAASQLRFGGRTKLWGSVSYGVLPINQIEMAAKVGLKVSENVVDAQIYPRFQWRHMLTTETGYKGKFWSVFASATAEKPFRNQSMASDMLYTPIGPATILSWGGSLSWREGLKITASYLNINEKPEVRQAFSDIDISLPSRFAYRKAVQVNAVFDNRSDFLYGGSWIYDIEKDSGLVSANVFFRPRYSIDPEKAKLTYGLGADFIGSSTGQGWIGQYRGNDRLRGSIAYAF